MIAMMLSSAFTIPARAKSSAGPATRPILLPLSGRQSGEVTVHQSVPIPSGSSANIQLQVPGAFAGSIPTTETACATFDLTLEESVQRCLRANLGIVSSSFAVEATKARQTETRSSLLPNIRLSASENVAKQNLAAEGFTADAFDDGGAFSFSTTVGPFHYYDLLLLTPLPSIMRCPSAEGTIATAEAC